MNKTMKRCMLGMSAVLLVAGATQAGDNTGWTELIGDKGLTLFSEPLGDWMVAGGAALNAADEKLLKPESGTGVLVNGDTGRTKHLLTTAEYGDFELHVEFMVAKNSNSGVYFQGRYEIQILDSYGVEKPQHHHCGGVYQRWKWPEEVGFEGTPPRVNAAREAGEWQTYDIVFRAPRFDEAGKKTENAMFVKVVHNGTLIHENQEVTGPTRAAAFHDEKPTGPLMFQGDHGPVALRNVRVKPLKD